MGQKFTKIEKAVNDGLELYSGFLEEKLTALYKIAKKRGKTEFGYLGDKSVFEYNPNSTEEDDRIFEKADATLRKWQQFFAEINDEYVEMSLAVSGVTYELEEKSIWVKRYQESWEGPIVEDDYFRVYPRELENLRPLVALMKLIAKELRVNLDTI